MKFWAQPAPVRWSPGSIPTHILPVLLSAHPFCLRHPLTAVATPGISLWGNPGRQGLHFLCICPDAHTLLGLLRADKQQMCKDREWAKDRGTWRRPEERTFVARPFWAPSGGFYSWVQAGVSTEGWQMRSPALAWRSDPISQTSPSDVAGG